MSRSTHLTLGILLITLALSTNLIAANVDMEALRRPEGLVLSTNEQKQETYLRSRIREAQKMISDGETQANTQDRFSKITQREEDLSHIREAGEEKIHSGENMIAEASQDLLALYEQSKKRNENLDLARTDGRMRNWTNTKGQSVEAAFIDLVGDKLTIQTPAGDEFLIALDQLIEEDQVIARFLETGLKLTDENFLKTVESGYSAHVMKFIEVGYSPSPKVFADALSICVRNEDKGIQTLRKLIPLNIDIDAYNSEGQTALSVAAKEGAISAAEYLLSAGAKPTIKDQSLDELTPLMWAMHKGNSAMVLRLAKYIEEPSDNLKGIVYLAENKNLEPLGLEVLALLRDIDSGVKIFGTEKASFTLNLYGFEPTITDMEKAMNNRELRFVVPIFHGYDFYKHTLERNTEYIHEIVRIWEDQSNAGDLGATYSLALNALYGWSVVKNPNAALAYLEEAAKKDHTPSMILLGELYEEGVYVEQTPYKAFSYYKNAAELEDPLGMVKLGHCYEKGIKEDKDLKKAYTWYQRATERGSTEGMAQLGRCYILGIEVSQNTKTGLEWFTKSANANNLSAMFYLGDYLLRGSGSRSSNANQGIQWLMKAAEFGDRKALHSLGEVYSDGTVKVDEKRASQYFLEAAERGEVASMHAIAERLAVGNGIDKDETAAFNWYQKASERGLTQASIQLAICYSSGKGVERNATKAFQIFRDAAKTGNMEAIANLAVCYARGLGTEVNEEESARLYLEVLNSGNQKAIAIAKVLSEVEKP